MPRNDKTGPQGLGPMTGRGLGTCAGNANQEFGNNSGFGRGFGRGRMGFGGGRGYGRFAGNFSKIPNRSFSNEQMIEDELSSLKEKIAFLEKQLSNVRKQD
ncbi:MAG: DUF5320 domain-containing protein [Saprospiraceae bacterium]|nr:DUF5320 domain-containing protein [Saprospiraceae bacterium]